MRSASPWCLAGMIVWMGWACGGEAPAAEDSPAEDWSTAAPEEVGMAAAPWRELRPAVASGRFGNIHAILIAREGKLVQEEYFSGPDERFGTPLGVVEFDAGTLHDLRSVSKSVTATLVGIAVDQGRIPSADAPLTDLLPDRRAPLQGEKGTITLRHVLSMSSGLDWNEETLSYADPRNDERRLSASEDATGFVLDRPLVARPGERFQYSGGMTHLLGAVLEEATGRSIADYAEEVLFDPLGIESWDWMGSDNVPYSAYAGVRLRGRDLLKLGQLYLDDGMWRGRRIVSEEWIAAATRPQGPGPDDDPEAPDYVLSNGYGYQWWWNEFETPSGPVEVATAVGNGGQRIIVIPRLDLVMGVFSGDYNDPRSWWAAENILMEFVVPSIETGSGTADGP